MVTGLMQHARRRRRLGAYADNGAEPERIVAVGGGTTHDLWPQIVSDVTGKTKTSPPNG